MKLWRGGRLATLAGDSGWGLIDDGALLVEDGLLRWVGPAAELPAEAAAAEVIELGGALVTPGFVDCHTHLVYGGSRANEFEQRLLGASYADIAKAGGGIRSTVAATRAASEAELLASASKRAQALMREGVTTLEVKSGYGLEAATEARMLRVARKLGRLGVDVRTTYLAAHALPPEFADADDYIAAVCLWLPDLHGQGLVDAVDAFCEHIAFSPAQVSRVFDAAQRLGLPVKLHAEQLSDQGGAQLAAGYRALSCDHLEFLSPAGVRALGEAGTVAVLLPGAFYALRETQLPPIAALRQAGVPIAIATDHNPGSSPTLSPLLMLNMACVLFRLTPEEALRGLTVNGARALGLADRGRLVAGQRADFCIWDSEHPRELAACFGHNPLKERVWQGSHQGES
ncbi:imidazolonepropionase [Roseateles saccharophilus]|uniref:Imidazolonepropionase n=1 Tax=Roseateles saccharophilus TaxID=304 RepID=A0A4R3UQV8_ROSSA|nr:imidazolonepropionase [Roseateles saccharophilus]MDG0833393.1 imidazolonepropionase [Roseateles saccharophilus]TCU93047.1 imidazolonepropionase [Roseateles saccharophilus]